MYHHVKQLMYDVKVAQPDVRFGRMLLEQFGGANGELAAAMQYTVQGWSCDDPSAGTCSWTSEPRRSATSKSSAP